MAMAADHAAPAPPRIQPAANAKTAAGRANGVTLRISSRSGSGPATLSPPVPQPDDVDARDRTQDEPDRQEDVPDAEQPVQDVSEPAADGDPTDHRRGDRHPNTRARPTVVTLGCGGHARGSIAAGCGAVKARE